MEENKPNWTVGYKEVKNFMHNEMNITKDDINDIFEKIGRDEVASVLGQNGEFIRFAIKEVIREEMYKALTNEHYPEIKGNMWFYDKNGKNPFNKFVSQVMKEEIINMMREQFEIGLEIKKKND